MSLISLPRPGTAIAKQAPLAAPAESHFTQTFGQLLPPTSRLETPHGSAAFYDFEPDSANGPTAAHILVLHGVQTPALGMLPLTCALQASFPLAHFCLVDLWGHGLSDTPMLPHDPPLFHALIDALLDRLGWSSAHLIGFSFGGALAVGFANTRPERVRSLSLVAPAGLISSASLGATGLATLRGDDPAATRAWVLDFLGGGPTPEDWKERVARGQVVAPALREWQMREHPGHAASVVAIARDGGVMDEDAGFVEVAGRGIPVFGVVGERDEICSKEQLQAVGFANVVVIPDVGHEVVRERAVEVAAAIEAFWKGVGLEA